MSDDSSITTLLQNAASENLLWLKEILADIDEGMREDLRTGHTQLPFRAAAVARRLHYSALSEAEVSREGNTKPQKASWMSYCKKYEEFNRDTNIKKLELVAAISDDDLSKFCTMATRRRGNQKPLFYVSMAIFAAALPPVQNDVAKEFLSVAIPDGEKGLPETIVRVLRTALAEKRKPRALAHEHPIIWVGFTFKPTLRDEFRNFVEHFASDEDRSAHFICYRPQHNDPTRLIKSFLAIKPPEVCRPDDFGQKNTFEYVHIYKVPCLSDLKRISMGKVVALEKGICLIGGQRSLTTARKSRSEPFSSLKVVTIPWHSIDNLEQVSPGLVMSANYQGEHLVSKLAIRATPIAHSDKVPKLDSIEIMELEADLAADFEYEKSLLSGSPKTPFSFEPARSAARILKLTDNNNIATGADMGLGVDSRVPHTLDGKAFAFWDNLRCGPLLCE